MIFFKHRCYFAKQTGVLNHASTFICCTTDSPLPTGHGSEKTSHLVPTVSLENFVHIWSRLYLLKTSFTFGPHCISWKFVQIWSPLCLLKTSFTFGPHCVSWKLRSRLVPTVSLENFVHIWSPLCLLKTSFTFGPHCVSWKIRSHLVPTVSLENFVHIWSPLCLLKT